MENGFLGNRHWYHHHPDPVRRQTAAPKVVQIPVHFVRSEQQEDRPGRALKIQKVFRGFMVRKYVKKIKEIQSEVDAIEERLRESDVMDLIKREAKERVRMNESLMSLLLKLDSITGSDFGVRVLRKAVIRKAIALQEMIDSLTAVDSAAENTEDGGDFQTETENAVIAEDEPIEMDADCEKEEEGVCESETNLADCKEEEDAGEIPLDNDGGVGGRALETKEMEADCENETNLEHAADCKEEDNASAGETSINIDAGVGEGAEVKENKRSRELVERMVEENAKMMRMIEQMCERSEAQSRMLNALSHRVELLEKAFVCDRLRRIKMKKKPAPSPCLA